MSDRLIGRSLGDFQLEALIGRGSVGKVYRATQLSLGRPVAVKVFEEGLFTLSELRERFLREAQFLARLEHPNIVPVYAAGQEENYYFYAMRLMEGETLERALAQGLALAPGLRYLAQVAAALAYAHDRGLIHRDVKPANVLIADGVAVLTDFGLARLLDESSLTASGRYIGTPLYFSPEQARMEKATYQSDLFALGIILYQVATGRHPFAGGSREDVLGRIREGRCEPPASLVPDLAAAVQATLARALAVDPRARHSTAHQLRAELLAAAAAVV